MADGGQVKKGETFVAVGSVQCADSHREVGQGRIPRHDLGRHREERAVDEATGVMGTVVIEHKEDLHPQIVIVDDKTKEIIASYSIPAGAHIAVQEGKKVAGRSAPRQDPA
ncbi:MAG: hypothetical protein QM767_26270 [Anaeromyxobacter sp.]